MAPVLSEDDCAYITWNRLRGTLANSEDPYKMTHKTSFKMTFLSESALFQRKTTVDLQRNKLTILS